MLFPDKIHYLIHSLVEKICTYLLISLIVSEISTVLLRYIYDVGFLKLHDFALYSFSVLVVMSIIYTYGRNNHVRVDVFREKQQPKMQQLVDVISIVLFLIPFFFLTLYWVWPDIVYAWQITEGSRETGGLPGLFIVKSSLPLMCILMIAQSLFIILRRGQFMTFNEEDKPQNLVNTQEAV